MTKSEKKQAEELQILGLELEKKITDRIGRRNLVEDRWLEDLEQYHGVVDENTVSKLKDAKKSYIFVNITRNKVNAASGRTIDLTFPSDRRNWGLKPTPVPRLKEAIDRAKKVPTEQPSQPGRNPAEQPPQPKTPEEEAADRALAILAQAKKAAEHMTTEIEDQLIEGRWAQKCREVISDAVILGTGILKAPIVQGRVRKAWETDSDSGVSNLTMEKELRPGIQRVSPWDFFPDMNARNMEESESFFERKTLTKQQMYKLLRTPGHKHFKPHIKELIEQGPQGSTYSKMDSIRAITGSGSVDRSGFYEVWEYHGPIEKELLKAAGVKDEDFYDKDALEQSAVVIFCQKKVIKVSLNPLETGDLPYSVFNWEKDDTCIFGTGVPYRLRNAQKVMNAMWRMMLDNSALSVGPQIVMNKSYVTPANGDWAIEGRKIWELTDRTKNVRDVFSSFDITNNNQELLQIFLQARKLSDEETNLPLIAQGDQRSEHTKTATGMQMLLASADVVMRRIVRSFDDDIIVPVLNRYYDWNMAYNDKPEIKGDFEIQALGSVAMMEAAATAESIQELFQLADHPVFGPMTDAEEMYRRVLRAKKIDPQGLILGKEERPQPQPDPTAQIEQAKLEIEQAKLQIEQAKIDAEMQMKQMELDVKREVEASKVTLDYEVKKEQMERTATNTDKSLKQQRVMEMSRQELEREKAQIDKQVEAINARLKQLDITTKNQPKKEMG